MPRALCDAAGALLRGRFAPLRPGPVSGCPTDSTRVSWFAGLPIAIPGTPCGAFAGGLVLQFAWSERDHKTPWQTHAFAGGLVLQIAWSERDHKPPLARPPRERSQHADPAHPEPARPHTP